HPVVVYEDVDPSEVVGGIGDQPTDLWSVGEVGDEATSVLTAELGCASEDAVAGRRDRDGGTLADQRFGGREPDPGRIPASRDDGGLANEFVDHDAPRPSVISGGIMSRMSGATTRCLRRRCGRRSDVGA